MTHYHCAKCGEGYRSRLTAESCCGTGTVQCRDDCLDPEAEGGDGT